MSTIFFLTYEKRDTTHEATKFSNKTITLTIIAYRHTRS